MSVTTTTPGNNLRVLANCSNCGHVSRYQCAALVVVAFEDEHDSRKVVITGEHFERFTPRAWQEIIEVVKRRARKDKC